MREMLRLSRVKFAGHRIALSPLKRRLTIYHKCQAIATAQPGVYDMSLLKTVTNEELAKQGIDAYVDDCRQITDENVTHVIIDLWVTAESPISAVLAAAIIGVLAVVFTVCAIQLMSAASSLIDMFIPDFYSPDGKVFHDLASYITYMTNIYNPSVGYPYTCPYCGQGFTTKEDLEDHMKKCPWKGGPPIYGAPQWFEWLTLMLIFIGGTIIAVVVIPKAIDLIRGK